MPSVRFLHIGDYKTGTTWLQRHVFGSDPRLKLIGEGATEADFQAWAALENLIYDENEDLPAWRTRFDALAGGVDVNGGEGLMLGVSRESLICGDPIYFEGWRDTCTRLRAGFGPVRVICTFREQFSLLSSLYSTYVKLGGVRSMRELYLDPAHEADLVQRLDYHRIASHLTDLFGADNCLFLTFDQLRAEPDAYLERLYRFIGLPPPTLTDSDRAKPNRSLSANAMRLQRGLNRAVRSMFNRRLSRPLLEPLIVASIRLLRGGRDARRRRRVALIKPQVRQRTGWALPLENDVYLAVVRKLCERLSFGRPEKLPQDVIDKFKRKVAESNTRLAEEFHLPIQGTRWRCTGE